MASANSRRRSTPYRTARRRIWRANTRSATRSFRNCGRGGERHEFASLRRAARTRVALLPRQGRLQGLHHDLRGPARPEAASRPCAAAPDGRRLRLRRRGRLEDGGARARDEGDGRGSAGRHVVHGRLHLRSRARRRARPRRAHARGLPVDRRRQAVARDSSA